MGLRYSLELLEWTLLQAFFVCGLNLSLIPNVVRFPAIASSASNDFLRVHEDITSICNICQGIINKEIQGTQQSYVIRKIVFLIFELWPSVFLKHCLHFRVNSWNQSFVETLHIIGVIPAERLDWELRWRRKYIHCMFDKYAQKGYSSPRSNKNILTVKLYHHLLMKLKPGSFSHKHFKYFYKLP